MGISSRGNSTTSTGILFQCFIVFMVKNFMYMKNKNFPWSSWWLLPLVLPLCILVNGYLHLVYNYFSDIRLDPPSTALTRALLDKHILQFVCFLFFLFSDFRFDTRPMNQYGRKTLLSLYTTPKDKILKLRYTVSLFRYLSFLRHFSSNI